MPSPELVTLFSQSGGLTRSKTSLVFSALLHGAGIAGLSVGILENPRIVDALGPSYAVQIVHMKAPELMATDQAPDEIASPVPGHQAPAIHAPGSPAAHPAVHKAPAVQILLQPNAPLVEIEHAIVPSLLMLSPKPINDSRQVVPQAPSPIVRTQVHPTMDMPATEANLADVQISSTSFTTEKLSLPASSTTPVAVQGIAKQGPAPQTRSEAGPEPAPTRVLSISDLQMTSGAFVLPHVSTAPHAGESGVSVSQNSSLVAGAQPASVAGTLPNASATSDSPTATPSVRRITLPKDGKFGMVVVGDSVEEAYPETADTWRGRPAYTVYLHVGMAKNWILQYALSHAAQANGSGAVARLEAPWPTDMLVPNLDDFSSETEALIVHGVLTAEGRLDQLTVVLPPHFSRAAFVLDALKQWIFRPATQNGQPVPVEILLIIPDQES